ncbi:MAG TPA: hypothetical protein VH593_26825, partial [Ktedonobacteraceae bacterium]
MGAIVVFDQHRINRQCLVKAIASDSRHTVLGDVGDFSALERLVEKRAPDFAIITLSTYDVVVIGHIRHI